MKFPYISELAANQVVQGCFLVRSKEVRQKKTGEPYLSLSLGDKSGEVDAKMWDNVAEVMDTFDRDDFVRVKGVLQVYQNRPQFTVHKLQRLTDDEVDKSDFFPASKRDPDEMFAELMSIVGSISNPHLKALLEAVFADLKDGPLAHAPSGKWLFAVGCGALAGQAVFVGEPSTPHIIQHERNGGYV